MQTTGESDRMGSYKTINEIYDDSDILFIKDIAPRLWYLTIMNDVYNLICNIIKNNNYKFVFGLTSSSGTMCLLNVLHKINIFKMGVVINGQTSLDDAIINEYKNNCTDCAIFDEKYIPIQFDKSLLSPFNSIPNEHHAKYRFYYSNSVSDTVYYNYIKTVLHPNLHENITFDNKHPSHAGYIIFLLSDHTFLKEIKVMFDFATIPHDI